jgi:hypothetical protein
MQGVKIADPCQGDTVTLEEHPVGAGMARFINNSNVIRQFPFRVVITTPDANGDTTFCGVVCHFKFVSIDQLDLTLLLIDDSRGES